MVMTIAVLFKDFQQCEVPYPTSLVYLRMYAECNDRERSKAICGDDDSQLQSTR